MQNRMNRFTNRKLEDMNVRNLDISVIKIGKYQKALNKARATAIAATYDPHRMRPIEVSYRDGAFYCFDGQTRIAAYKLMGKTKIPAIIHEDLNYEAEARLFASQQDNVGSVLSSHKWNALVEAKDHATLKTIEIALKNGFRISAASSARTIAAVKTLQDIVLDDGFDMLDEVLSVIGEAWNNQEVYCKAKKLSIAPTNVAIINGVYLFLKAYRNSSIYDRKRLVAVLAATKPTAIMSRANDSRKGCVATRVAAAILEIYNQNLKKNRLSDKFREV